MAHVEVQHEGQQNVANDANSEINSNGRISPLRIVTNNTNTEEQHQDNNRVNIPQHATVPFHGYNCSTTQGNDHAGTPITAINPPIIASNNIVTDQLSNDSTNGFVEPRITDRDLDAIESIDIEPEVATGSLTYVPEHITGTKVEMRRNPSENIPEERYLSLIASSPSASVDIEIPEVPQEEPANQAVSNAQKLLSNTRRSLTDLITPTPELSETLSVPRKPNMRRTNEYVKTKPKIEKLRMPTSNTSAGSVRETPL